MRLSPVDKIVLAGFLKRYIRVGFLFVSYKESVASHSFRAAYIALELAKILGEKPGKHVRSALWHDFHEALTLDVSYLGLRFAEEGEEGVREKLGLPEITDIARDADVLELIATAWSWGKEGSRLWIYPALERLKLPQSKELAEALLEHLNQSTFYQRLMKGKRLGAAERILLTGVLKQLPRSGWLVVGIKDPESVADHVFRTAIIADLLAEEEGADPEEEVVLAILHDLPEAVTGDQHKLAKLYQKFNLRKVWEFIGMEEPRMSTIVRDADTLELLATIKEYESVGVKGLERWKDIAYKSLKTETARAWAEEIMSLPPLGDWYVHLLNR